MDNPEILFYILFGLIYFLTRGKKKKKNLPPKPKSVAPPSKENEEEMPSLSFEELLKQLTGQGKPGKPAEPEPEEVVEVKESIEVSDRQYKPVDWTKDHMGETLISTFEEEAIKKRYEEATADQSLETIGELKDTKPGSGRFLKYKIEEKYSMAAEIKEMLTDPDDIKKAVILNEVLARKF